MKLDYSALENSVHNLEKSRAFSLSDLAKNNKDLYEQFRAATIQSFESSYELATKMLRRQLDQIVSNPQDLREMRNITSHTYDADKAEQVMCMIDGFIVDIKYILAEIKKRNT